MSMQASAVAARSTSSATATSVPPKVTCRCSGGPEGLGAESATAAGSEVGTETERRPWRRGAAAACTPAIGIPGERPRRRRVGIAASEDFGRIVR